MSRERLRPTNGSEKTIPSQRLEFGNQFVVDVEHRTVIVKFSKTLKAENIERYVQQLKVNAAFEPTFSEIVDLSRVERVDLRGEDVLRLADHVDPFSFDSKRAFVTKDSAQAHQARMYQISRMSKDKIRSFRSVEEAERWIRGDR